MRRELSGCAAWLGSLSGWLSEPSECLAGWLAGWLAGCALASTSRGRTGKPGGSGIAVPADVLPSKQTSTQASATLSKLRRNSACLVCNSKQLGVSALTTCLFFRSSEDSVHLTMHTLAALPLSDRMRGWVLIQKTSSFNQANIMGRFRW